MLKSKIFDRVDLSHEYYEKFNCGNKDFKKKVGYFEVESIDKANVITSPKEYYERFVDSTDNKKHKGLHKSTPGMDLDSYSDHLSDLT